ncbi:unnamed protein product [Amoebophrya sp. A120]|nr:unnamed protein product [Amoebophrya sp. A120]|eukprot:GSA120T00018432001.1
MFQPNERSSSSTNKMANIVRQSSFRHVWGDPWKAKWEDLRPATKVSESSGVKANSQFVAIPWGTGGGGNICLLDWKQQGRMPPSIPVISGHQGGVLDFEFNPFDENMIASVSEDCHFRIFQIPDGGLKENLKQSVCEIPHPKKVSLLHHNPAANGIVATGAYDHVVRILNTETQDAVLEVPFTDLLQHIRWNHDGDLLTVCCKDKFVHIIDPRVKKGVVALTRAHEGVKSMKTLWLDGHNHRTDRVLTTGFSSMAERQVCVWDLRNFTAEPAGSEPLHLLPLDQGTGALFPFYDADTRMLYLAGKGDGNVKYFEMVEEAPFFHYVSDYRSTTPQKGFDFLPKYAVDTAKKEIMRGVKCESGAVQAISFVVPRKSEAFQSDLYPDTLAPIASLTADEWEGGAKKPRTRMSMNRESRTDGSGVFASASNGSAAAKPKGIREYKEELAQAHARIAELETENRALKAKLGM